MLIDVRSRLAAGPTEAVVAAAGQVILGKERQIRLAMACILARGHLLIEDVPGVGKTTLSHALARLLGLDYQRIQFTSDLLPADIIGVSIFDRDSSTFRFHPGPIFAQIILADEINRASPKAQSALLEAMEEHQVTAEGETRPLPEPFFVIAALHPGIEPAGRRRDPARRSIVGDDGGAAAGASRRRAGDPSGRGRPPPA